MDLIQRNFPNVGVVEGQLPEDVVDNIWKVVNEAREQPEAMIRIEALETKVTALEGA